MRLHFQRDTLYDLVLTVDIHLCDRAMFSSNTGNNLSYVASVSLGVLYSKTKLCSLCTGSESPRLYDTLFLLYQKYHRLIKKLLGLEALNFQSIHVAPREFSSDSAPQFGTTTNHREKTIR